MRMSLKLRLSRLRSFHQEEEKQIIKALIEKVKSHGLNLPFFSILEISDNNC